MASAADINAQTLEQALAAAPPLFVGTYEQRGKRLSFAPDRRVAGAGACRGGKWGSSCELRGCCGMHFGVLEVPSAAKLLRELLNTPQFGSCCVCRDVSGEVKTPVDWMHMPLAFETGERPLGISVCS